MSIRYQYTQAENTDSGAVEVDLLGKTDAFHHQIAIKCAEVAGTFTVKGMPLGLDVFQDITNSIDLSAPQPMLFEGVFSKFEVTPVGVAASTAYTIALVGLD